ncbi:MAG: hypothetical protein R6V59_04445 [Dehalococcoidia bacterium]
MQVVVQAWSRGVASISFQKSMSRGVRRGKRQKASGGALHNRGRDELRPFIPLSLRVPIHRDEAISRD